MKKYSSAVFMLCIGLMFMSIHMYIGWPVFVQEAATHGETATVSDYLLQWGRDTAENLQSEFIQLAVQFSLLAGLFEAWKIKAYEKDQEEVKQKLDDLAQRLESGVSSGNESSHRANVSDHGDLH